MSDLDLDALEEWAGSRIGTRDAETAVALVAEVRALRAKVERVKKVEREYQQESANDLLTAKTRHYAAAVSQNIRDALRGDGS